MEVTLDTERILISTELETVGINGRDIRRVQQTTTSPYPSSAGNNYTLVITDSDDRTHEIPLSLVTNQTRWTTDTGGVKRAIEDIAAIVAKCCAAGGGGGGGASVIGGSALGLVNGSNTVFTTAFDFDALSLSVFINGLRQTRPTHYGISGANEFTFIDPPEAGDDITTIYNAI